MSDSLQAEGQRVSERGPSPVRIMLEGDLHSKESRLGE